MTLLVVALAALIGVAAVQLLWPTLFPATMRTVVAASFGVGAGIGICSLLYFLWLVTAGPKILALGILEIAILGVTATAAILKRRHQTTGEPAANPNDAPGWLTGAFVIVATLAIVALVISALRNPNGGWDAFSIWNLRARFLERGGDWWRDAFSARIPWAHPDYPLLLPGIVAMVSALSGSESALGPISIAFLFLFGSAGVLVGTIALLRGRTAALLAGILLLSASGFVLLGVYQYADVPLSFYILANLAALCLQDKYGGSQNLSVLAGAMAGFAAWTKNEGLLFASVVVVARAFSLARFEGLKPAARQMEAFAAGLLPPLAVLAVFKFGFAPPNDLLTPHANSSLAGNILDAGRYITVISGFVQQGIGLGRFVVPIVLVLAVYLFLLKTAVEDRQRVTASTLLLTIGLMLVADFGVYQLLSYALDFQLKSSLDRVLLQLWPAGILAFFFVAKTPQLQAQVAEKRAPAKHSQKLSRKAAETR
jgi:hypothetical protein